MHKKPTMPFGHIAFGKDGSVRKRMDALPDIKDQQEFSIGQRFAEKVCKTTKHSFEARSCHENDHDFWLKSKDKEIVVQATEIVSRDYLRPLDIDAYINGRHHYSETIHEGSKIIYGVDASAKNSVLSKKIERKLAKHYAKPTKPFWLIIWTLRSDFLPFYSSGGRNYVSSGVELARHYIARKGTGPFDEIWFFYPETRPHRIWPL